MRLQAYPPFALLLLFLFSGINLYASQEYFPEMANPLTESWRWKNFPELEGKGVRCITEDKAGKIWFGVNEGLLEYDGYQWKWHRSEDGLPGGAVELVFSGEEGLIYAATAAGVFFYDAAQWHPLFVPDEELDFSFLRITQLEENGLWIGTNLGALQIINHQKFRFFTTQSQKEKLTPHFPMMEWVLLPSELIQEDRVWNISDIIQDKQDNIWLAVTVHTYGKILTFQPQSVQSGKLHSYQIIGSNQSIRFGENQKMIRTQDNTIWVTNNSYNVGIHTYNGKKWETIELGDLFGGDEYTTDVAQSSDGTIWIGSLGKLYSYRNQQWEIYKSPDFQIPANKLMFFPSRGNKLWIGGIKSKIYLLDYSTTQWLTYKNLNFQLEKSVDELWFLDVKGRAIQKNGDQWMAFDTTDGFIDSPVRMIITSKKQIWAAGSHQGVAATAFFQNGKWYRQSHPNLSWGIDYRAVFEAQNEDLWFGASVDHDPDRGQVGGVLQLKNPNQADEKWIHHRPNENGIAQSNAYGIGQCKNGSIWIGGGNLYEFDGKKWAISNKPMLQQFVNIVNSTPDQLLVGSRYYGIFLYDGQEWKQYDTESGLASNTIISLYADSENRIWAATENDISHFDGKVWINHVFPVEMNMNFEGGAILGSSGGALWINKSNREWKRQALSYNKVSEEAFRNFVTYRYLPDKRPPETRIEIYAQEVSPDGNTIISWEGEDFFEATNSKQLTYSYRLDGGEWSPFSQKKLHTFLNLSSKTHTFEVRARDLDLNIDPSPARIQFEVHPPVWRQAWFQMLLLAFLAVISIFEYRIIRKKQKLEKLNEELNIFNSKLEDKGNKIATQNQEILEQQQQILAQKQKLEKSNQNLADQNIEIQFQRDQLEEMITQIEDLSKSKINFFTNISHELRTPLTLILGPIERLRKNKPALLPNEQQRLHAIIERNAYRLLKLINQLLELRRIENNTLELDLCQGNLALFLSEIIELFDNLALEKQIYLSFQNRCQNAMTLFDPDKIEKIITNLLSNAFKHTPAGGSIFVSLEEDKTPEGKTQFRIIVEDSGDGMSAQELEHIFERYYSATNSSASSGIGLSYIKDLIELQHGHINVISEKEKGARFTICLPAKLETTGPMEKIQEKMPQLEHTRWEVRHLLSLSGSLSTSKVSKSLPAKSRRILIVEDNDDMLAFLENILNQKFIILKAQNGIEALQVAQNHQLDLILSDVMMPKMDGLAFCKVIKSNFATSHIPLILLTAKSLDEHRIEGFNTGADDYISKPFNAELLEIRIENLLKQREQLRDKFTRDFMLNPKEVQLTSPDEELLNHIVQIMEKNISNPEFNVNKMCEMVHLSHMHFIRKVKQLTGKKPIDLLKSFRLKRAKDLLGQNKSNIAEVAYSVGYDLPNSFSRAFKREFGLSPTEWMESLQNKEVDQAQ